MQAALLNNTNRKLLLQIGLVLVFFQIHRVLFFAINHSFFPQVGATEFARLAWHGIRYDLSVICSLNAVYLILSLLPFCQKVWQRMLNVLFLVVNIIAFLFDLSDIGYFPYVHKRMSAEVFHLIGNKSDFIDLLPAYLQKFWYVSIAILVLVGVFFYLNNKINKRFKCVDNQSFKIKNIFPFLLWMAFIVFSIRGGWQLKPIQNNNALLVASNQELPLVLNTPFSILHSFQETKLVPVEFMSEQEARQRMPFVKNYYRQQPFNSCNVVMIVLESFGKSYTGIGGRKSYTPFLDSIMQHSLVCTHAFANAFRSADGIPACVSGIPCFMKEPFPTSPYATNTIEGLPALLKKKGYHSTFFHGGTNGTMSFDVFAKNAGFDEYIGRSEYQHDEDYDGTWGIWDEPFLQFTAKRLSQEKQPFFSTVFTLSSHEPFVIPKQYANEPFASYQGIFKGISYSDVALRKFFATVSKQSWFANTLFVITADHNFLACRDSLNYYNQGIGLYSIPVVFYQPGNQWLRGNYSALFQQIDILPTVLDYVHYPNPFYAMGKSAFDTTHTPYVFTQMDDYQQFYINDYVYTWNDTSLNGIYHFPSDSTLQHSLPRQDSVASRCIPYFQAVKQQLVNGMIQNKWLPNSYSKP